MENAVSLFIPVYNAARLIRQDIKKSYAALLRLGAGFEIIVVDDNSTDVSYRFQRVINKAKRVTGKQIKYISYNTGPSRRENLAKSFYLAKYEIIGFIDVDFSCDISYFLKAVKLLIDKSADMVIGSRYIKGAKVRRRPVRRILSFFYNFVIKILFNSTIQDHQCGLKVFRKSAIFPILDKMGYDEKYVRGWFWDAELLIRAQKAGLKIIEMPVEWHFSDSSTFNFKRELRCLSAILKLKEKLGRI